MTCWRASPGCSSATTKRIERIGRGIKRTDEALDGSMFCYGNNLCSKKIVFRPQFHHRKFQHLRRRRTWVPRLSESILSEPRSRSYHTLEYKHIRESIN